MPEEQLGNSSDKSQKLFPIILILGLVAFGYLFLSIGRQVNFRDGLGQTSSLIDSLRQGSPLRLLTLQEQEATDSYKFSAVKDGQTPFSLLQNNEDVEFDQYDFGVFVTAINKQKSSNEFYWALYVNDEYAQLSADKIELTKGDQVEWRWEEVSSTFDQE